MLTTPSGTTTTANMATIHGIIGDEMIGSTGALSSP